MVTYCKAKIDIVGYVQVNVLFNNKRLELKLFLSKINRTPILGSEWSYKLLKVSNSENFLKNILQYTVNNFKCIKFKTFKYVNFKQVNFKYVNFKKVNFKCVKNFKINTSKFSSTLISNALKFKINTSKFSSTLILNALKFKNKYK